eukprot:g10137.t1
MQGSQRLKKSPKFGRSRKVSSKYVLKKNRGTEDNPETGSEDGSATTRPPEPRSRLMKYEEALQILLNGPPDLSQDEILGDSDNEEEESHYTPQIVKLVAGSCPIRWKWQPQDLETPYGSKKAQRLHNEGSDYELAKPVAVRTKGRWVKTALLDVQDKLDPKLVKSAVNGGSANATIKVLAATKESSVDFIAKGLTGLVGPLLVASEEAREALRNDEFAKLDTGEIMIPHSQGGAKKTTEQQHRFYYQDYNSVLHNNGNTPDGQMDPKVPITAYGIGDGDIAMDGLWSRTLHHCSINGTIASIPTGKQGYLDLSSRGISNIPKSVWSLRDNLGVLNLSDNRLQSLDEDDVNELGLIKELKALLLGENVLKEYPSCIDKLEHLTVLQLSNNRIPRISPEIKANVLLTMLCIDGNELTALPEEMKTLTRLTHLLAHENLFTEVPPVLEHFTNLQELFLQGNKLQYFPGTLASKLTKLEYLDLAGNQLYELPGEIGELKKLEVLSLSANQLVFEGIPWQLGMLTDLKKLYMHGNTKLKKEPPAVSRLLQCGSLVECELGLQNALKNAIVRGFSNNASEAGTNPKDLAIRAFRNYDNDGSACIDYMEFKAICVDLGVSLSKNELKEAMDHLDENSDGTIGEDEFVNWFVNR